jgi:hypothetical protein
MEGSQKCLAGADAAPCCTKQSNIIKPSDSTNFNVLSVLSAHCLVFFVRFSANSLVALMQKPATHLIAIKL